MLGMLGCVISMGYLGKQHGQSGMAGRTSVGEGGLLQAAKKALLAAIPNAKSDHLAVVVAFDAWVRAAEGGGRAAASAFCTQHFISHQATPLPTPRCWACFDASVPRPACSATAGSPWGMGIY